MYSPIHDVEFLARSEHRVDVLNALSDTTRDRPALQEATGASSATLGRILSDFEERKWVVRSGYRYELTSQGRFVLEGFGELLTRMETEQKLRDVLELLPAESLGFTLDMFTDATVTVADEADPYRAVRRFDELIEGAKTMRAFGTATLKSANVDTLHRNIVDGMETEIIYPPPIIEAVAAWNPAAATEAAESGNLRILLYDALPCGLTLFDGRVALTGYTQDTGLLRVVVDTENPDAFVQAEEIYGSYREESRPFAPAQSTEP
ncbi:helix-turn-helix transcriptional regulator [Haladaptatus halobius]|uniref:helix-turn-helix transcriptional regulator n=1 Tax=Haladaptatus halobius TaxID=2884875 RepID=UPI001D0B43A1|nr:transcriptional regulator [Haladaptatus halobius]